MFRKFFIAAWIISIGSVFDNSYGNLSIYGAGNLKYPILDTPDLFRIEPGIAFGLASGYNDTPNDRWTIGGVLPMILPNVTIIMGDVFFGRISYLPDLFDETTSMILIQSGFRFYSF